MLILTKQILIGAVFIISIIFFLGVAVGMRVKDKQHRKRLQCPQCQQASNKITNLRY
jgi:hypothetical protein